MKFCTIGFGQKVTSVQLSVNAGNWWQLWHNTSADANQLCY